MLEGFSSVMPVTGLNRPNTGKEEDDDDDYEKLECIFQFSHQLIRKTSII
jgi:hypothetical protein